MYTALAHLLVSASMLAAWQSRIGFVFEGVVLGPDGAPSSGAIVVSSAGGQAATRDDGTYRLEITVPVDARRVELTAVAKGAETLIAHSTVDVLATSGASVVEPLVLAQGTCPFGWLPTFGEAAGVLGRVYAMTVFDDGSGPALYVGGDLWSAGSSAASRVAKWDGAQWSAVGSWGNFDIHYVYALAVFDDGGGPALYAGGGYHEELGGTEERVLKWNGATWSGISGSSSGFDDAVYALAVYDDGTGPALYAGGLYSPHLIQKWDGTSWSTLGSGVNGSVHALCVFDDGGGSKLIAGGWFSSAGGSSANRIASWDGTSWSALGSGMSGLNAEVRSLAAFDDGSGSALYAGGVFASAGGIAANHIAKWNGSTWSALNGGMSSSVEALAVFDDGGGAALYAGGEFTSAGGVPASRIAAWHGGAWSALGSGADNGVFALAPFDDGGGAVLSVGGEFKFAGGTGMNSVANWDGADWSPLGEGLNDQVLACAVFDDGSGPALYAGGRFEIDAGGVYANGIARWDGMNWSALGSGLGGNWDVRALAVFDDGGGPALFAGGSFASMGGVTAANIAKWNGASWSALGSGTFGYIHALTVFDDGTGPALYAGGNFSSAGGVGAKSVAKWNGTSWSPLGGGTPGQVYALCVFDDGSGPALFAGGNTWFQGPGLPSRIAKWTGSTWVALGAGVNLDVYALTLFDDGGGLALYAAGAFTSPGNHIAKWDGTNWSALGIGTNGTTVDALTVFDDGGGRALYAGGAFTVAGGVAANRIAKWSGGSWSPLGSGMNGQVLALASFDDGTGAKLHAGGTFTNAFDSGDGYFARWGCLIDVTAPVLTCPGSVLAVDEPTGPPGTIVTFTVTADDDLDLDPDVVSVPPSGSFFPRGSTLVNCTATDNAGNQSTCQFTVTVVPKARASASSK